MSMQRDRPPGRSGLRDDEHDGQDRERDAADGEQRDRLKLQRYVPTGAKRMLQLTLTLRADEQQADRQRRVTAPEQHVRPRSHIEEFRGEPADAERADA